MDSACPTFSINFFSDNLDITIKIHDWDSKLNEYNKNWLQFYVRFIVFELFDNGKTSNLSK